MKPKVILNYILIYVIYMAVLFASIFITSALAAFITSLFTKNIEIIINVTLLCIWMVMIIIYSLRSRFLFKRRMQNLTAENPVQSLKERKFLIKRYTTLVFLSSLIIGYVFISIKPIIINNILNNKSSQTVELNDPKIKYMKYILLAVIIGFWLYKELVVKKKY